MAAHRRRVPGSQPDEPGFRSLGVYRLGSKFTAQDSKVGTEPAWSREMCPKFPFILALWAMLGGIQISVYFVLIL